MTSSGFFPLTLISKTREYDQVYTFRFSVPETLVYQPGQYVHLLAPQSPPGPENVRHLSVASVPGEDHLMFTVDLGSASPYKQKLAALEPGGKAHLFKVKGEFVLGNPVPARVVFLAGGLGVTPIRSLAGAMTRQGLAVDWRLAHVARGPFLYQAEMEGWGGTQVRVRKEEWQPLLDRWTEDAAGVRWYVAGSNRFVQWTTGLLADRGIDPSQVSVEDFR